MKIEAYKQLVEGLTLIGEGLIEIGASEENPPIKLLVAQLMNKLGFNDPEVGELVAMIRFAVENDDLSLEKLTASIAGGKGVAQASVETPSADKPKEDDKPAVEKPEAK